MSPRLDYYKDIDKKTLKESCIIFAYSIAALGISIATIQNGLSNEERNVAQAQQNGLKIYDAVYRPLLPNLQAGQMQKISELNDPASNAFTTCFKKQILVPPFSIVNGRVVADIKKPIDSEDLATCFKKEFGQASLGKDIIANSKIVGGSIIGLFGFAGAAMGLFLMTPALFRTGQRTFKSFKKPVPDIKSP